MSEQLSEQDKRDSVQAQNLKATILLNIAMNQVEAVNALAALAQTMGTLIAGMTIGLDDEKRKVAIDSSVAADGPLCKSVRIAAEAEIPNVKKFEAAKAAMGGGAASTRPSSPEPKKGRTWGDLG